MTEIRTYEGDGQDIANLLARTWRSAYQGKHWCPLWDADYIRWQLLGDRSGGHEFLVSAYDGRRLVGCVLAERMTFRLHDREVEGTIGSWLTVDPEARSPNLSFKMVEELGRRHREHGLAFLLGYVNGNPATPAHHFWTRFAKKHPRDLRFIRRIGYWIRILNAPVLSRKCLYGYERIGARVHGWIPPLRAPGRMACGVRDYSDGDFEACEQLVRKSSVRADLSTVWRPERLARQLRWNDLPRTLVIEPNGSPSSLINYHQLGLLGIQEVTAGLIDLLTSAEAPARDRRKLLRSALYRMEAEGFDVAFALRTPMFPPRVMLACGFLPRPGSDYLVYVFPEPGLDLPAAARPDVLLR